MYFAATEWEVFRIFAGKNIWLSYFSRDVTVGSGMAASRWK